MSTTAAMPTTALATDDTTVDTDVATVDVVATTDATIDGDATTVDGIDEGDAEAPNTIPSTMVPGVPEVVDAVKGVIGYTKNPMSMEAWVPATAKMSYEVDNDLEDTIGAAKDEDKLPLSTEDFLAWSRAKRGRNDARGRLLMANTLMNMLYLAYCTAVAMEYLGDWIRDKCSELEDKAERARDKESDAAQERADRYDEIRDEYEPYADEAEGSCSAPAGELKSAIEAGDLDAAIEAIENGDFFLDIGFV